MRERGASSPCYSPQVIAAMLVLAAVIIGAGWAGKGFEKGSAPRLAIAFAGTGIIVMGYRWLEIAGLPEVDWGTFTWPLMALLWAGGFLHSNRRYS
jgi:hypothetical protein